MRAVPVLTFDTADEGFVREPWPRYEEIRRLGGVVYNVAVAWPLFRRFLAKNS